MPFQSYAFVGPMMRMYPKIFAGAKLTRNLTSDVRQPWWTPLSSSTTSTTSSTTSTTPTTPRLNTRTTTTTLTGPPPMPNPPPSLISDVVEGVLDNILELITVSMNDDGRADAARCASTAGSFEERVEEAAVRLNGWTETMATAANLTDFFVALGEAASLVPLEASRPLNEVLLAIDAGLPAEWDKSTWYQVNWSEPITPPTNETERDGCLDVSCDALSCGDLSQDFLCVAWSGVVERWVPATGCRLAPVLGGGSAADDDDEVEVVCECEKGALYEAIAIATRPPKLLPPPARQVVTTREYLVANWRDKAWSTAVRARGLRFQRARARRGTCFMYSDLGPSCCSIGGR